MKNKDRQHRPSHEWKHSQGEGHSLQVHQRHGKATAEEKQGEISRKERSDQDIRATKRTDSL